LIGLSPLSAEEQVRPPIGSAPVTVMPGVEIRRGRDKNAAPDTRTNGTLRSDDFLITQVARFGKDPQPDCLQGAALFGVTSGGVNVMFKSPREALPFQVSEQSASADEGTTFLFSAAKCRLRIRTVKEVRRDGLWISLAPKNQ